MTDILRFPNGGYEVTVCRKSDILDCIEKNITDRDVALAVIEHCEFTAAEYIKQGRWTGLPYMGSIRKRPIRAELNKEENKTLLADAKETLDEDKFIIFRKALNAESARKVKAERYYKYMTSIAVRANREIYDKLCKTKGEVYARLYLFCSYHVTALNNEYNVIEDNL